MADVAIGHEALGQLRPLLEDLAPDFVLVVTGGDSYKSSGAMDKVEPQLSDVTWHRFPIRSNFPGPESTAGWSDGSSGRRPDLVVAVGGGAVIDSAKLIALSASNGHVEGLPTLDRFEPGVPVVAIPTTAGSGSERTPFAVTYVDGVKYSVEHPSLLPVLALVDPELTWSMSPELTAAAGLDALAHSIESMWATRSTDASSSLSRQALEGVWENLERSVTNPEPEARSAMSVAASMAGAAIGTAKTTASHALSYHLTMEYGLAHGTAAAITLGPLLAANYAVDARNCADNRGPEHVRSVVSEILGVFGVSDVGAAVERLGGLLQSLPVPRRLREVGLTSDAQVAAAVESVNLQRLQNNPRRLDDGQLEALLRAVI